MKKVLILISSLLVSACCIKNCMPLEKNFGYDFTCHSLQQCKTIARNKERVLAAYNEAKNMTFEKYLETAAEECYDYLDTNEEYCACTDKRRRETATEQTKELFIEDTLIRGWEREKEDEWRKSEKYKRFYEYVKGLGEYCKEYYHDYDAG